MRTRVCERLRRLFERRSEQRVVDHGDVRLLNCTGVPCAPNRVGRKKKQAETTERTENAANEDKRAKRRTKRMTRADGPREGGRGGRQQSLHNAVRPRKQLPDALGPRPRGLGALGAVALLTQHRGPAGTLRRCGRLRRPAERGNRPPRGAGGGGRSKIHAGEKIGRIFGLCQSATNVQSGNKHTLERLQNARKSRKTQTRCQRDQLPVKLRIKIKLTFCRKNIENPLKQLARQIFAKPWNSAGAEKNIPGTKCSENI